MPSRFQFRKTARKNKSQKGYFKIFFATFLVFILILVAGGVTGLAFIQGAPNLSEEQLENAHSSAIYDMNGKKIADIAGSEHRIPVKIENVPNHVKEAFIAIEDARFREHFGIDVKRIAGAALANIKEGWGSEGGSTITQQVVKNTYLSPEKTIKRKVQEAYLSIKMERKYSKDEILEMYLNKIYFGHGAYGLGAAADVYFGKKVEDLTVAEAALLAGLPQRPSGYDPIKHPENALERRSIVLSLMEKHGFISEEAKQKAKATKLEEILYKKPEGKVYQAFIDHVIEEMMDKGIKEDELYTGGLKIYTTLDPKAQSYTEKVMTGNETIPFPNDEFKAGVVLLDTKTGAIRAIGGNRNPDSQDIKRGFNYATDIKRQPGSTIKPILDYGPAIEYEKWSTYHQIEDEELEIDGKEFQNYDEEFHGMLSMREALVKSYNIPAIKAFMEVGGDRAKKFAGNVGINLEHAYASYAIGGFGDDDGVSPLDMAGAYAAFGNQGKYSKPYSITKIEYPTGETKKFETQSQKAMNQYTAYMVTDMLKDVVTEGTGRLAQIDGLPVAGKTGTTNPPDGIDEGSTDSWFVGYTTNYTAAVWTGYETTTREQYVSNEDSKISKLLFKEIMSEVSKDQETKDFKMPSTVKEIKIDERNGRKASSYTPSSSVITELFVEGTDLPNEYKPVKKKKKKDNDKEKEEKEKEKDKEKDKKKEDENGDDGSEDDGSGDDGSGDDGSGDDGSGDDGSGDGGSGDDGSGDDGSGDDGSGDDGSGDDGSGDDGSGDDGSGDDGSGDDGSGDDGSGGDGSGDDSGGGDDSGDGTVSGSSDSSGDGSGDNNGDGSDEGNVSSSGEESSDSDTSESDSSKKTNP